MWFFHKSDMICRLHKFNKMVFSVEILKHFLHTQICFSIVGNNKKKLLMILLPALQVESSTLKCDPCLLAYMYRDHKTSLVDKPVFQERYMLCTRKEAVVSWLNFNKPSINKFWLFWDLKSTLSRFLFDNIGWKWRKSPATPARTVFKSILTMEFIMFFKILRISSCTPHAI